MKINALIIILMIIISPIIPQAHAVSYRGWSRTCSVYIVAVSSSGGGVVGNLTVRVEYPGHGRVYISTSPASMIDTQGSARIAAFAASLLAGMDMTQLDFYYDISSNAIIVGGPSAGFAMALATLLALKGESCNRNFAVTGMIQPDTSIGPVGGLKEKLEAASKAGAKLFIIPAGQEVYKYYKTEYKKIGPIIISRRVPVEVNLTSYGSQLGVRVMSAATLNDGYKLITGKSLLAQKITNLRIDRNIQAMLKQFITSANATITKINSSINNYRTKYIKTLALNSTQMIKQARSEYSKGKYYKGAIYAVEALRYAYNAMYIDEALHNNLDVTNIIENVNETLQNLYNQLEKIHPSNLSSKGIENLAKAWAKLGISAYYFQNSLRFMESENGHYKLPSFLGSVDVRGAEYLAESMSLADWARFWFEASEAYPGNTTLSRVTEVSMLVEAEARTTAAYLQTLLEEAGASTGGADLPIYLTQEAMSTNNSVGRLGLSIEAIALSTSAIHSTFTLRPSKTAKELFLLASTINSRITGGSIQASLLLSYAESVNNTNEKLLSASKAVLYSWTALLLSGGNTHKSSMPSGSRTTTPAINTKYNSQENKNGNTTITSRKTVNSKQNITIIAIIIGALIVGILIGAYIPRKTPSLGD